MQRRNLTAKVKFFTFIYRSSKPNIGVPERIMVRLVEETREKAILWPEKSAQRIETRMNDLGKMMLFCGVSLTTKLTV